MARFFELFGGRSRRGEASSPVRQVPKDLELMVTLWPSFSHFPLFASDDRLSGIRLNSAMMSSSDLDVELQRVADTRVTVPLYFDVKGRQLRVVSVEDNPPHYLDLVINHPISVRTPTDVLLKAGMDRAELSEVLEDGYRLRFKKGIRYIVHPGESLHILDHTLRVGGSQFVPLELEKIAKVRAAGFTRYFLSYVQSQRDVDEFLELVGRDAQVMLKIEDQKGLRYVLKEFKKRDNLTLVAARGDLYVELLQSPGILYALKLIIDKDPHACVGSRIFLSIARESVDPTMLREVLDILKPYFEAHAEAKVLRPVLYASAHDGIPSCADFSELAWLYDIGYRSMMLCDELCLKGELLKAAVHQFEYFRHDYTTR